VVGVLHMPYREQTYVPDQSPFLNKRVESNERKCIDCGAAEIDLYLTAFAFNIIAHCLTLPNEVRLVGRCLNHSV